MSLSIKFQQMWFSSALSTQPKWRMVSLCGVVTLLLYVLCKEFFTPLAKIAEPIMLLCGFLLACRAHGFHRSIWIWLLVSCISVQLFTWGSAMLSHPEWSSSIPTIDRLGKLFFFIPVAFLLVGNFRNVLLVWFLFGLGLVLAVMTFPGGVLYWKSALNGGRVDFGMQNAQHTAMYFGVLLLMLISLVKLWVYPRGKLVIWRTAVWLFAVIFSVFMLYVTQTRAVLIGLMLAFFVICMTFFVTKIKSGLSFSKKILTVLIPIVVCGTLVLSFGNTIKMRMHSEEQTTQLIMQGNLHAVPYSSIGIRVQTWLVAIERVKERPILGWGDRARSVVIKQSTSLPEDIKQQFGHLHNYFIEMQLSYGLLGSIFLITYLSSLVVVIYRGWRAEAINNELAVFGLAFLVYWLFINNFESYLSFNSGVFVFSVVVGGLLTQIWKSHTQITDQTKASHEFN